jgi:hypothetical protein
MKATSNFRIFITVAVMMTTACSDPEIAPSINPTGATTPVQTREYHTAVTTWGQSDGTYFVGIVSNVPNVDLSKTRISVVENGKRIRVDNELDVNRLTILRSEGYFWATARNNVLLLNYIGPTPNSAPPFPLEVIIVY